MQGFHEPPPKSVTVRRMLVLGISGFDTWHDVILVEARQGRFRGDVPLNDLEVVSKNDPNYWPVEEYVVWHANRQ